MDASPIHSLCRHLIATAVQRCRLSQTLCRLSLSLKSSNPLRPSLQFSVSDTGAASSLAEFRSLNCFPLDQCDGVLSIKTTGTEDEEVYIYSLDLKDRISEARVKRMPSLPKKGIKFSGTEASFIANVNVEETASWLTCLFQKMLIVRFPKIILEMVVDLDIATSSKSHCLVHPSEDILPLSSVPYLESLASGFLDYVLKQKFALNEQCGSSPLNRENLKIGCGAASNLRNLRSGQTVEAVILLMDLSAPSNSTFLGSFDGKTEVMYFEEFMPCAIPLTCLNALTSVNWKNYNLSLKAITMNGDGSAVTEWENRPKYHHIDIILHSYREKVFIPQQECGYGIGKNIVKRAIKAALDDLKAKYTDFFLSKHASKIHKHAPDLSRTIEGLILSSDDIQFQEECLFILGLQNHDLAEEGKIESCIKEKIEKVIEMKDLRPKNVTETKALLFNDNFIHELEEHHDVENEESESEFVSVELG